MKLKHKIKLIENHNKPESTEKKNTKSPKKKKGGDGFMKVIKGILIGFGVLVALLFGVLFMFPEVLQEEGKKKPNITTEITTTTTSTLPLPVPADVKKEIVNAKKENKLAKKEAKEKKKIKDTLSGKKIDYSERMSNTSPVSDNDSSSDNGFVTPSAPPPSPHAVKKNLEEKKVVSHSIPIESESPKKANTDKLFEDAVNEVEGKSQPKTVNGVKLAPPPPKDLVKKSEAPKKLVCKVLKTDDYIYFLKKGKGLSPVYEIISDWDGRGMSLVENEVFTPISIREYDGIKFYQIKPLKFLPETKFIKCTRI